MQKKDIDKFLDTMEIQPATLPQEKAYILKTIGHQKRITSTEYVWGTYCVDSERRYYKLLVNKWLDVENTKFGNQQFNER